MTCLMTAVTKTARAPKPGRTVDLGAANRMKRVPASTRTGIKLLGMLTAGRVFLCTIRRVIGCPVASTGVLNTALVAPNDLER